MDRFDFITNEDFRQSLEADFRVICRSASMRKRGKQFMCWLVALWKQCYLIILWRQNMYLSIRHSKWILALLYLSAWTRG